MIDSAHTSSNWTGLQLIPDTNLLSEQFPEWHPPQECITGADDIMRLEISLRFVTDRPL